VYEHDPALRRYALLVYCDLRKRESVGAIIRADVGSDRDRLARLRSSNRAPTVAAHSAAQKQKQRDERARKIGV